MKIAYVLILTLCMLSEPVLGNPSQYVVVNIAAGRQAHEGVFEEIRLALQPSDSDGIGLGVGGIFSYFRGPREEIQTDLAEFLRLSEKFDIPVVAQIDGEQWWGARPDLWNWWDAGRPGYDPNNRLNVEWSGWSQGDAVKIGWRNWGQQLRVLPPPNFMSTPYREACREEMRVFVPQIIKWREQLGAYKKHLLIGIKIGWESSIGVNTFYYPNGNALLGRPASQDPQSGLKSNELPARGVTAIGYAAVKTAGLAADGELKESHLAEVVRRHLDDLAAEASRLGVERERLFTHAGGWKKDELLYDAAVNRHSSPGWSFYRHAADPAGDSGVQRALRSSDAPCWAAVEWLYQGEQTTDGWQKAMEKTLADPKCRYLCIYNWRGIKNNPAALGAIRNVLRGDAAREKTK